MGALCPRSTLEMQKPFKFRFVNEISGAFVLVVAILLLAGIVVSGQIQGWFEPHRVFEVTLPDIGTQGIRAGSEVRVVGSKAGTVTRVELRDKNTKERFSSIENVDPSSIEMVAILEVRSKRVAFIGRDSKAILKFDLGGFGAPFFEISRGKGVRDPEDTKLELLVSGDVKEGLTGAVDQISAAVVPAVKEIRNSSRKIGELADEIKLVATALSSPEGNLQSVLANVNEIMSSVEEGESPAGVLLKDKAAGGDLREAIASIKKTSEDLESVLNQIGDLATKVQRGEGAAGALLADAQVEKSLRDSLTSIESATAEIDDTLRSIPQVLRTTNTAIAEYNEGGEGASGCLWLSTRFSPKGSNGTGWSADRSARWRKSASAPSCPLRRGPVPGRSGRRRFGLRPTAARRRKRASAFRFSIGRRTEGKKEVVPFEVGWQIGPVEEVRDGLDRRGSTDQVGRPNRDFIGAEGYLEVLRQVQVAQGLKARMARVFEATEVEETVARLVMKLQVVLGERGCGLGLPRIRRFPRSFPSTIEQRISRFVTSWVPASVSTETFRGRLSWFSTGE